MPNPFIFFVLAVLCATAVCSDTNFDSKEQLSTEISLDMLSKVPTANDDFFDTDFAQGHYAPLEDRVFNNLPLEPLDQYKRQEAMFKQQQPQRQTQSALGKIGGLLQPKENLMTPQNLAMVNTDGGYYGQTNVAATNDNYRNFPVMTPFKQPTNKLAMINNANNVHNNKFGTNNRLSGSNSESDEANLRMHLQHRKNSVLMPQPQPYVRRQPFLEDYERRRLQENYNAPKFQQFLRQQRAQQESDRQAQAQSQQMSTQSAEQRAKAFASPKSQYPIGDPRREQEKIGFDPKIQMQYMRPTAQQEQIVQARWRAGNEHRRTWQNDPKSQKDPKYLQYYTENQLYNL